MKILLIGAEGRMGRAVTALAEGHDLIKIGKIDITPFLPECDIVLDFSTPLAVEINLPKVVFAKKPMVIGVTALSKKCLLDIHEASRAIPIFLSSNFSPGIALLKQLLKHLPEGSYEITETHHIHKKDAPSGTALDLATKLPTPPKITSHREGSVIGQHKIQLTLPFEKLELHHEVLDRNVFAQGSLAACSFLFNKPPALYTSIYDESR